MFEESYDAWVTQRKKFIYVAFSNSWFKDDVAQSLCFNVCHENLGKGKLLSFVHRGTVGFKVELSNKLGRIFFED